MKKLFILTMCFVLLLTCGCSKKNNRDDIEQITESAPFPTVSWSTALPEQLGIDPDMLSKADKRIRNAYPNIESLLLIKDGYLVYEKYYNDNYAAKANYMYSVTKSFTSALTGIAIREGLIESIDDRISEYIPEYFTDVDDLRKKDITVKHVLTMTGGLESIDSNYTSYFSSTDWLSAAINKPMTDDPGARFEYNTGLTQLLSGVITKTSGMSMKEFAEEYLFSRIGMNVVYWESDSNGYSGGGSGLCLTAIDMAKFGYLYLNNGMWDGEQVIPSEWIEASTSKQITANETQDYGYLFWVENVTDTVNEKTYSVYQAYGSGGQIIMIAPELDIVIVITCDRTISPSVKPMTRALITDYILPSAHQE